MRSAPPTTFTYPEVVFTKPKLKPRKQAPSAQFSVGAASQPAMTPASAAPAGSAQLGAHDTQSRISDGSNWPARPSKGVRNRQASQPPASANARRGSGGS